MEDKDLLFQELENRISQLSQDELSEEEKEKPEHDVSPEDQFKEWISSLEVSPVEDQNISSSTQEKPELSLGRLAGRVVESGKEMIRLPAKGLIAAGRVLGEISKLSSEEKKALEKVMAKPPVNLTGETNVLSPEFLKKAETKLNAVGFLQPNPKFKTSSGTLEDLVGVGAQVLGQLATTVFSPVAGTAFMGLLIGGSSYEQLTEENVDPNRAAAYGLLNAFLQAPLEYIGIRKGIEFWDLRKGIVNLLRGAVEAGGEEFWTEFLQTYPDFATTLLAEHPDKNALDTIYQIVKNPEVLKEAFYQGFLGATWGSIIGASGSAYVEHVKSKLRKLGFTDADFKELNANPLLTPEDILQRKLRASREKTQDIEHTKNILQSEKEEGKDVSSFKNIEKLIEEETNEELKQKTEDIVQKEVEDSQKRFLSGMTKEQEEILNKQAEIAVQERENIEALQDKTRQEQALHEQLQLEEIQRKRQEYLQELQQKALDEQKQREQAIAEQVSTPEGLIEATENTILTLENSNEKYSQKLAQSLKRAYEALQSGEDNPKTLRKIKLGLKLYSNAAPIDPETQIVIDTVSEHLEIRARANEKPIQTQTQEFRGVEESPYKTDVNRLLQKLQQQKEQKQKEKAEIIKEVVRHRNESSTGRPVTYEQPIKPPFVSIPEVPSIPKPSEIEQKRVLPSIQKGKAVKEAISQRIQVQKLEQQKQEKFEAKKQQIRKELREKARQLARKVQEKEKTRSSYMLTPKYSLPASKLTPNTTIGVRSLKSFIEQAQQEPKRVQKEIERLIEQKGVETAEDWVHPSKIAARVIYELHKQGKSFLEAKKSVKSWIDKYNKVYHEAISKHIIHYSEPQEKVTKLVKEASKEAQEAHKTEVENIVKNVKEKVRKNVKIEVDKTVNDIKRKNPDLWETIVNDKAFDAKGLFHNKKIHLFSNNLQDSYEVKRTIWHELGHYSLEDLLGERVYPLLDEIYSENKTLIDNTLDTLGWPNTEAKRRLVAEELLIHEFTTGERKYKVKTTSLFKQFIKRIGFDDTITSKDIENLFFSMKKNLLKGKAHVPVIFRKKELQKLNPQEQSKYLIDWATFARPKEYYIGALHEIYEKVPKALSWYNNHQARTIDLLGEKDAKIFNVLLALTSPNCSPNVNMQYAVKSYLYLAGLRDKPHSSFPNALKKQLDSWMQGNRKVIEDFEKGTFKVTQMIRALLGDTITSVHDKWMKRIFYKPDKELWQDKEDAKLLARMHHDIKKATITLANEMSKRTDREWSPIEVQAGLWVWFRAKTKGLKLTDDVIDDYEKAFDTRSKKLDNKTAYEYLKDELEKHKIGKDYVFNKYNPPLPKPGDISKLDKQMIKELINESPEKILVSDQPFILHFGKDKYSVIEPSRLVERIDNNSKEVLARMDASTEEWPYVPLAQFYTPSAPKEWFKTTGVPHTVSTKGKKIYNAYEDPLRLTQKAYYALKESKLPNAAYTNILSNLIKKAGFDGFATYDPYSRKGIWINLFKDTKVDIPHVKAAVGISNVVQEIEELPQEIEELKKLQDYRLNRLRRHIYDIQKLYPEVRILNEYPQIAHFGEATSGVKEISARIDVEGSLPAIRAMFAQIAHENSQNSVIIFHNNTKQKHSDFATRGSLISFKVKDNLTENDIEELMDKNNLVDYNLRYHPRTGDLYFEQFFDKSSLDNDKFERYLKVFKEIADTNFPQEKWKINTWSEYITSDYYEQVIKEYLGNKAGEERYAKATKARENYRTFLETANDRRIREIDEDNAKRIRSERNRITSRSSYSLDADEEARFVEEKKRLSEWLRGKQPKYSLSEITSSDIKKRINELESAEKQADKVLSKFPHVSLRDTRVSLLSYPVHPPEISDHFICPVCKETNRDKFLHKHSVQEYKNAINKLPKYEIPAWHGGWYFKGPFSDEFIGSGEGNATFGWGFYFTESKEIAKWYADRLKYKSVNIKINDILIIGNGKPIDFTKLELSKPKILVLRGIQKEIQNFVLNNLEKINIEEIKDNALLTLKSYKFQLDYVKPDIDKLGISEEEFNELKNFIDDLISSLDNNEIQIEYTRGQQAVYEVTLHKGKSPEEYDYIEWYKPLSEEQRRKIKENTGLEIPKNVTGGELYKGLAELYNSKYDASMFLLRAGIDGIKYPAGSIQGTPIEGVYNYVVFDPRVINIEHVTRYSSQRLLDALTNPKHRNVALHLGNYNSPAEKVSSFQLSRTEKLIRYIADKYYPLKKLAILGKAPTDIDPWVSKRMMANMPSILESFFKNGDIKLENNWISILPNKDGGIYEIYKLLGDDADFFFHWMTAKSAEEILNKDAKAVAEGKPSRFKKGKNLFGINKETGELWDDREFIKTIYEYTQDRYERNKNLWEWARQRLREINKQVLDFAQDAGIIDGEQRAGWERDNYIPFYRLFEDWETADIASMFPKEGPASIGGIHTLHGSTLNVGDPFTNLCEAYSYLIHESLKNLTNKKAIEIMLDLGLASKVPAIAKGNKGVLEVKHKGKSLYFKVHDPILYDSIATLHEISPGVFSKVLSYPKRLLTWGVTIMPAFRLRNFIRDTFHVALLEKSFRPVLDSFKGLYHALKETEWLIEYKGTGGAFTGAYHQRDVVGRTGEEIEKIKQKLTTRRDQFNFAKAIDWYRASLYYLQRFYDFWNRIGEASENAARLGLYMRLRKEGASKLEAGFRAMDLLDFHLSGDGTIARLLIQTVPFLNARIQGLYKVGRVATDPQTRASFFTRGLIMSALALLYGAIREDDDRYKDLSKYEKWNYVHFWFGNYVLRLPLPFEVGALFWSGPIALSEALKGTEEWKYFKDWAWFTLTNTFQLDFPQVMKPIITQVAGKDLFTGISIIPPGKEKLEPWLQKRVTTSKTAIELARILHIPATRIDQFVRDILGASSAMVLFLSDQFLYWIKDYPSDPFETDKIKYILGSSSFWRKNIPRYTRSEQEFYDLKAEIDQINSTINAYRRLHDYHAAKEYYKKHQKKLRIKPILDTTIKRIRTINQQIELIIQQSNLSPKRKREKIDELLKKRNQIFRETMKRLHSRI